MSNEALIAEARSELQQLEGVLNHTAALRLITALCAADEREQKLREAIHRIFHAQIYESGEMANGVSLDMIDAIYLAEHLARLDDNSRPSGGNHD
jgi:hypothetical protein